MLLVPAQRFTPARFNPARFDLHGPAEVARWSATGGSGIVIAAAPRPRRFTATGGIGFIEISDGD